MGGFLPFLARTPSFFPTFPHLFPSLTLFAFAFALCSLPLQAGKTVSNVGVLWMDLSLPFIFTFFCFFFFFFWVGRVYRAPGQVPGGEGRAQGRWLVLLCRARVRRCHVALQLGPPDPC